MARLDCSPKQIELIAAASPSSSDYRGTRNLPFELFDWQLECAGLRPYDVIEAVK